MSASLTILRYIARLACVAEMSEMSAGDGSKSRVDPDITNSDSSQYNSSQKPNSRSLSSLSSDFFFYPFANQSINL